MSAPHPKELTRLEESLQTLLAGSSTLSFLVDLAAQRGEQLYLVGGFLRDVLFGRPSNEVDLVAGSASELAAACVRERGARLVEIDRRFGALRLIPRGMDISGSIKSLDLSPLRGSSILEDLISRDFTVNAVGLDLLAWRENGRLELIDPLDGLADLRSGRLRACTSLSFVDDPLRILRAYRFLGCYPFSLDSETRTWINADSRDLKRVAVERIRDELSLVLESPRSASIFRMLDADGVLRFLLPECEPMRGVKQNAYHHLDVWSHSLLALEVLEGLLARPEILALNSAGEVSTILAEKLGGDRTRLCVVKLATLLHDVAKPVRKEMDDRGTVHFYGHELAGARLAVSLCSRLRFSNREIHEVGVLVRQHMRIGHLLRLDSPSSRALSRFFRLGPSLFWPLILLSAADYGATAGPLSRGGNMPWFRRQLARWLEFYYQELRPREAMPSLLNGHDLMKELHLAPGPLVGRLLRALRELQWEGRISTLEEARREASRLLGMWGPRKPTGEVSHSP